MRSVASDKSCVQLNPLLVSLPSLPHNQGRRLLGSKDVAPLIERISRVMGSKVAYRGVRRWHVPIPHLIHKVLYLGGAGVAGILSSIRLDFRYYRHDGLSC
jgi:hypothetical protein